MKNTNKNPVTDNVGTGISSNSQVVFTKAVSASRACDDPYYGLNPPIYREIEEQTEEALLAALRKALRATKEGYPSYEAKACLAEVKQRRKGASLWRNWVSYAGNCRIKMHDAVRIGGILYIKV